MHYILQYLKSDIICSHILKLHKCHWWRCIPVFFYFHFISPICFNNFTASYVAFLDIDFLSEATAACDGSLTDDHGLILSPNHPDYYPKDTECVYEVSVSNGKVFTILNQKILLSYSKFIWHKRKGISDVKKKNSIAYQGPFPLMQSPVQQWF